MGDVEPLFFQFSLEVVGLVIGCTDPRGGAFFDLLGHFVDELWLVDEFVFFDVDYKFGVEVEIESEKVFYVGSEASFYPWGGDGIFPAHESDLAVADLMEVFDEFGDSTYLVLADAIDVEVVIVFEDGDGGEFRHYVANGIFVEVVDEDDALPVEATDVFYDFP